MAHVPGQIIAWTTFEFGGAYMANRTIGTTIAEWVAQFPKAFTLDPAGVRPLKLGIRDDLYALSAISHRRIIAALTRYCKSATYLKATTEGAVRINLAGEPAGNVSATEAQHAMERLAVFAKTAAKRASKASSAMKAPSSKEPAKGELAPRSTTAGPRRLSLNDLRKAAAARKGG
jgi:ProP effector